MTKPQIPITVLDLSKGIGYGFLYHPVIGKIRSSFPLIKERPSQIKKRLCNLPQP